MSFLKQNILWPKSKKVLREFSESEINWMKSYLIEDKTLPINLFKINKITLVFAIYSYSATQVEISKKEIVIDYTIKSTDLNGVTKYYDFSKKISDKEFSLKTQLIREANINNIINGDSEK